LEVGLSKFGVLLDLIIWVLVSIISLKLIEISFWKRFHGDSGVEHWASFDTQGLSGSVGVLLVLHEEVLLVAHHTVVGRLALKATLGASDTSSSGFRSGESSLALHAFTRSSRFASMAVLIVTLGALFASGSVILNALGIGRVHLDLT
jgi:hypothetical protein